jgi:hypothetical protein
MCLYAVCCAIQPVVSSQRFAVDRICENTFIEKKREEHALEIVSFRKVIKPAKKEEANQFRFSLHETWPNTKLSCSLTMNIEGANQHKLPIITGAGALVLIVAIAAVAGVTGSNIIDYDINSFVSAFSCR